MSFFAELKRRNVIKVAVAYIIVGWLIMQAGDTLAPALHLPDWVNSALAFFLILGFPLAMFFAWAFELTPDGLKKEKDIDRSQSITRVTGRKLDFAVIGLMAIALSYFIWESRFSNDTAIDASSTVIPAKAGTSSSEAETQEVSGYPNSIAVLPFANMSDDGANEYFSDGLSEELLNLLAKIPELKVAARTSSFQFKGQTGDIADIANQLKVEHILEGSVRKSGNQVRITAQLIKADDGYHLWSETYDRTLENIFAVQDEIAVAVVEALKITLLGATPVVSEVNAEAYALFLQGRYFYLKKGKEDSFKAVEAYESAITIDESYAAAWAGLALAVVYQAGFEFIEYEPGLKRALGAAERAVLLDPTLPLAWVSLSEIQGDYLWDWEDSYKSAEKAVALDPANSDALARLSSIASGIGRLDSSLVNAQKAVELDPLNLFAISELAARLIAMGRMVEAEQQSRYLLELSPEYRPGQTGYIYTLMLLGRYEEALAIADEQLTGKWQLQFKSMLLHNLGRRAESDAELNAYIMDHHEFWAYQIAEMYSWRGQPDEAFKWLDAALAYRDPGLGNMLSDGLLINIQSDPRWEAILEKIGLLEAWKAMPDKYKGAAQ